MKPIHYYIIILLATILLIGCEITDNSNKNPSPTSPDSVTILTSGRVTSPAPGRIDCEDSSTTIPANQIAQVRWVVRAPTGNTADSGTSAPSGEITFSGLADGSYTVEQTVILKDGSEGPPRTYDVEVE